VTEVATTVLRWADRRTEPWANGLGVTHPLARDVTGDSWRISIAEIEVSSPFSRFPHINRQLVCLGPGPLKLMVDDRPRDVAVGDVTDFSGDSDVWCEVDRPSLALNVMSPVGSPAPRVQVMELQPRVSEQLHHLRRGLVVVLTGSVETTTGDLTDELGRLDAVEFHDTTAELDGAGRVVLIAM
jgi:environmental stress-induced protein Ves